MRASFALVVLPGGICQAGASSYRVVPRRDARGVKAGAQVQILSPRLLKESRGRPPHVQMRVSRHSMVEPECDLRASAARSSPEWLGRHGGRTQEATPGPGPWPGSLQATARHCAAPGASCSVIRYKQAVSRYPPYVDCRSWKSLKGRLMRRSGFSPRSIALSLLACGASLLILAALMTPAGADAAECPARPADAYSLAVLADSPLAYYRVDESAGPTICDSSAGSHNGTYYDGM